MRPNADQAQNITKYFPRNDDTIIKGFSGVRASFFLTAKRLEHMRIRMKKRDCFRGEMTTAREALFTEDRPIGLLVHDTDGAIMG